MKSFNINAKKVIVRFECPVCKVMIEEDVTDLISRPDFGAETAVESEKSDSKPIICPVCGAEFSVEVHVNFNEGNVLVCDAEGNEIEDIELIVEL